MVVLADTSVWAHKIREAVGQWLASALVEGGIAMCEMVALELLFSARSGQDYEDTRSDLQGLPWLHMDQRHWDRALEVQGALAARGRLQHKSVKIPDLLIAATAELGAVRLVHYDHDFELIAGVTGQDTAWVAPRGSL